MYLVSESSCVWEGVEAIRFFNRLRFLFDVVFDAGLRLLALARSGGNLYYRVKLRGSNLAYGSK